MSNVTQSSLEEYSRGSGCRWYYRELGVNKVTCDLWAKISRSCSLAQCLTTSALALRVEASVCSIHVVYIASVQLYISGVCGDVVVEEE